MKIIVVGCGKVGLTLTEQLNNEGHDITVIDKNADTLKSVTDSIDVMGVEGNGAIYQVQIEAGIKDTDLLIATTDSDELNMLCCLIAKKAGNCHTIARIRNPEYANETRYIREELNLSMAINPELAAAKELAAKIKECTVTVSMKTGEGGRTFGTVSTKEVAEEAKKQLGLDIDKKKMKLDVPIKALGNYIIQIKLHKDVTAELTVKVVEK